METMRDAFSEIVDYAGLFPPATCSMADAVRHFDAYRNSSDRWMLGRFVVAGARLGELAHALTSEQIEPAPADPWRLSVVMGGEIAEELPRIALFNADRASRGVVADAIEFRVATPDDVVTAATAIPHGLRRHFEVPITGPYEALAVAMKRAGVFAKVRTGGTTPELFPSSEALAGFLAAVTEQGLPFKATAGLHHPIRGTYPLTYAPDAPHHTMFGFVNVLLATAELARGGTILTAQSILEEADASQLFRDAAGLHWRDHRYGPDELAGVRTRFFLGFGSCSFREPVDELRHEGIA
jgi:hypothetical protein